MFQAYKSLVMRIREPRSTAIIYKSGSVVCTGAKRSVCLPVCLDLSPITVVLQDGMNLLSISSVQCGGFSARGQKVCPHSAEAGLACLLSEV